MKPDEFLVDWVTNTQKTIDGKMANPNGISITDYLNPNFPQQKKDAAEKILTFFVEIID